eukprot:maker-scaffold_16-snap-gene-6.33-mRNA-1 protein AED:0.06 eAED:0.06 QI:0/0.5/0/1/1/1/3/0/597
MDSQEEHRFIAKKGDWPIKSVTVYEDQAEICRVLEFAPKTSGQFALKLEGLTNLINFDSVRAEISAKNSTLVEILPETKYLRKVKEENINFELEEPRKNFIEDRVKIFCQEKKLARTRTKFKQIRAHRDSFLNVINPNIVSENAVAEGQFLLDPKIFKEVGKTLSFYGDLLEEVFQEAEEDSKVLTELHSKLINLFEKQRKIQSQFNEREVTVVINIPKDSEDEQINVKLFYLVRPGSAQWKASYDITVDRVEGKQAEFIKLKYYAEVKNFTQEDWVDVELFFSTAQPSLGGSLPPLPRLEVDFKPPEQIKLRDALSLKKDKKKRINTKKKFLEKSLEKEERKMHIAPLSFNPGSALSYADEAVAPIAADVSGDAGATFFRMQRLVTVEATTALGSNSKKQTITITQLDPKFLYVASPKVSPDVFLQCKTKNTSEFPFLSGKYLFLWMMSFVRKNEEFDLFLGIDSGVRLDYKPEKLLKKQKNALFTTNMKSKRFLREITLHNTKSENIQCILYEQIPYSTEEKKIKVQVINPDFKNKKEVLTKEYKALINSFNNMECHKEIKAGKSWKLKFEYSVEWPADEAQNISFYSLPDSVPT